MSLVRDGFCGKFKNDLLWLIILCAVKVCDSMKNWGYINSDHCASCRRKETIDHCFLHCPRVKEVWLYFLPELGCGKEACLIPATGCLGIALPPSAAHFPSGKKAFQSIKERNPTKIACFSLCTGQAQTGQTEEEGSCSEVRLEVQRGHECLPQGYRGKEFCPRTAPAPRFFMLT